MCVRLVSVHRQSARGGVRGRDRDEFATEEVWAIHTQPNNRCQGTGGVVVVVVGGVFVVVMISIYSSILS